VLVYGVRASVGRVAANGPGSRRSIRFARLALERHPSPRRSSPPSVALRPASCGAFVDERRIVADDGDHRVYIQSTRSRGGAPLAVPWIWQAGR
jgi:hypothetical protein